VILLVHDLVRTCLVRNPYTERCAAPGCLARCEHVSQHVAGARWVTFPSSYPAPSSTYHSLRGARRRGTRPARTVSPDCYVRAL
jgi:hypothetical protein